MQPSDSVIYMVVRFPWVKADLSYQMLHPEMKYWCRRLCMPWLEKSFSDTVQKREYAHRRTCELLIRAIQVHVYTVRGRCDTFSENWIFSEYVRSLCTREKSHPMTKRHAGSKMASAPAGVLRLFIPVDSAVD
jgi:hypothetical protein